MKKKEKTGFFKLQHIVKGFSLVELSIVLIVFSVLTIMILKGAAIVFNARVVVLSNEIKKYDNAAVEFKDIYNTEAGLLKNASAIIDGAQDSDSEETEYVNTDNDVLNRDSLLFFNQLSYAKLLGRVRYDGGLGINNVDDITSSTYPFSKAFKDKFFYVRGDTAEGTYNKLNRLAITDKNGGGLDAEVLYALDTKLDDGLPLTGKISIEATDISKIDEEIDYTNAIKPTSSCLSLNKYAESDDWRYSVKYNIGGINCSMLAVLQSQDENIIDEDVSKRVDYATCEFDTSSLGSLSQGVTEKHKTGIPTGGKLYLTCTRKYRLNDSSQNYVLCNNGMMNMSTFAGCQLYYGEGRELKEYIANNNITVETDNIDDNKLYPSGSSVKLQCKELTEFVLDPSQNTMTFKFVAGQGWTTASDPCKYIRKCYGLPSFTSILNGSLSWTLTRTGLTYTSLSIAQENDTITSSTTCDTGYEHGTEGGEYEYICTADGTWSMKQAHTKPCVLKRCYSIPPTFTIDKGNIVWKMEDGSDYSTTTGVGYDQFIYGVAECNEGYEAIGSTNYKYRCNDNKNIDKVADSDMQCNLVRCNINGISDIDGLTNNYINNVKYKYNGTEYTLNGNVGINVDTDPELESVEYGEFLEYSSCVSGYANIGGKDNKFTCQADKTWSKSSDSRCLKQCSGLPGNTTMRGGTRTWIVEGSGAEYTGENYMPYGTVIVATTKCYDGYTQKNTNEYKYVCGGDGVWSMTADSDIRCRIQDAPFEIKIKANKDEDFGIIFFGGSENGEENDCVIDWGDKEGAEPEQCVSNGSQWHVYETDYKNGETTRTIKISGKSFRGVEFARNPEQTEKIVEVVSYGSWDNIKTARNAFGGASNLLTISPDTFAGIPNVESFEGIFAGCTSLKSIPSGLFEENTEAISFAGVFAGCASIKSIPSDLFKNNTQAEDFMQTFAGCVSLTSIPGNLFENNTNVKGFVGMFIDCISLTSIPSGLFTNNTNAEDFTGTFGGCWRINSIPSDLFNTNKLVKSFNEVFAGDRSLKCVDIDGENSIEIGENSWPQWNKDAVQMDYAKEECKVKEYEHPFSIKINIDDSDKIFRIPFYAGKENGTENNCTISWGDDTETPCSENEHTYQNPDEYFINIYGDTFTGVDFSNDGDMAKKITQFISYGEWENEISTLHGAFAGASKLSFIEREAFKYVPNVVDFSSTFAKCTSLVNIPEDLFGYSLYARNFSNVFSGSTSLPCSSIDDEDTDKIGNNYNWPNWNNKHNNIGIEATMTGAKSGCLGTPTFKIEVTIPSAGNCFNINFTNIFEGWDTKTCTIDWGDGRAEYNTKCSNNRQSTHCYDNIGKYIVSITGDYSGIQLGTSSKVTRLISYGKPQGVIEYGGIMSNMYGLKTVEKGAFKYLTDATSFARAFEGCYLLENIPEDLFAYSPNVTRFDYTFNECTNLTEIPANLFANNKLAEDFDNTFINCENITNIPEGLFANNVLAKRFRYTFSGCTGLTEIPANLFVNNSLAEMFGGVFTGCTGLTEIPENLFPLNKEISYDFSNIFRENNNINYIPSNLFANNKNVGSFYGAFYNNNSLMCLMIDDKNSTEIGENSWPQWGKTNTNEAKYGCKAMDDALGKFSIDILIDDVSNGPVEFTIPFVDGGKVGSCKINCGDGRTIWCNGSEQYTCSYSNTGIKTVTITNSTEFKGVDFSKDPKSAEKIMRLNSYGFWSKITSLDNAFNGAINLIEVDENAFIGVRNVETANYTFAGCKSLQSIPQNLFFVNDSIKEFNGTFANSGLENIPSGLFKHNRHTVSFAETFAGTNITSVPEGLFDNSAGIESVTSIFRDCKNLNSIPRSLFEKNTNIKEFSFTFADSTNLLCVDIDNKNSSNIGENNWKTWRMEGSSMDGAKDNCKLLPNEFEIKIKVDDNDTFVIPLVDGGAVRDCNIDCGNNAQPIKCNGKRNYTCGYTQGGEYTVKITDASEFHGVDFSGQPNSAEKITEIINYGSWENILSLNNAFKGAKNLKSIAPKAFSSLPNLLSLDSTFQDCKSLESIPDDLFANNIHIESFLSTFMYSGLKKIPSKLFANNKKVVSFDSTFFGCGYLTSIPNGLFDNNVNAKNLQKTFAGCDKLSSIPKDLFKSNTNINSFEGIFNGDSSLSCVMIDGVNSDIKFGLNSWPTWLRSASMINAKLGCNQVPEEFKIKILIDTAVDNRFMVTLNSDRNSAFTIDWGDESTMVCSDYTTLYEHAYSASSEYIVTIKGNSSERFDVSFDSNADNIKKIIELISYGKWDNMTSIHDKFNGAINLRKIASGAFALIPNVEDVQNLFYNTSNLKEIPSDLFVNNTKITNFDGVFNRSGLESIPEKLFENNKNASTFRYTFLECKNLTSIPEGIFDNNVRAEDFYGTFEGCENLASIPKDLFINNTAVTTFENVFRNDYELLCVDIDGNNDSSVIKNSWPKWVADGTSMYNAKEGCKVIIKQSMPFNIKINVPYSGAQFTIPFYTGNENGENDCFIDWLGNGGSKIERCNQDKNIHVYSDTGDCTIQIFGSKFRGVQFSKSPKSAEMITEISNYGQWNNDILSVKGAFAGCKNVERISTWDVFSYNKYIQSFNSVFKGNATQCSYIDDVESEDVFGTSYSNIHWGGTYIDKNGKIKPVDMTDAKKGCLIENRRDFVIRISVNSGEKFTIPFVNGGEVKDCEIDCGNGIIPCDGSENYVCEYDSSGEWRVAIRNGEQFQGVDFSKDPESAAKIVSVEDYGRWKNVTTLDRAFMEAVALRDVSHDAFINLPNVESANYTFTNCKLLEDARGLFRANNKINSFEGTFANSGVRDVDFNTLPHGNTSTTNFSNIFANCENLNCDNIDGFNSEKINSNRSYWPSWGKTGVNMMDAKKGCKKTCLAVSESKEFTSNNNEDTIKYFENGCDSDITIGIEVYGGSMQLYGERSVTRGEYAMSQGEILSMLIGKNGRDDGCDKTGLMGGGGCSPSGEHGGGASAIRSDTKDEVLIITGGSTVRLDDNIILYGGYNNTDGGGFKYDIDDRTFLTGGNNGKGGIAYKYADSLYTGGSGGDAGKNGGSSRNASGGIGNARFMIGGGGAGDYNSPAGAGGYGGGAGDHYQRDNIKYTNGAGGGYVNTQLINNANGGTANGMSRIVITRIR